MTSSAAARADERRSPAASLAQSDHLAATEAELAERFPDVPRAFVHALVLDAYESLADARIRDFLPLLVRRIVHNRLVADRQVPAGS